MLRHSCLDGVGRRIHTYLYATWMPDEPVWQIGGDFITVMDMEKYIRAPNKYPRRGTQSIQSMDTGQWTSQKNGELFIRSFLVSLLSLGKRILASYVGHFKPWRETKEEFHMVPRPHRRGDPQSSRMVPGPSRVHQGDAPEECCHYRAMLADHWLWSSRDWILCCKGSVLRCFALFGLPKAKTFGGPSFPWSLWIPGCHKSWTAA